MTRAIGFGRIGFESAVRNLVEDQRGVLIGEPLVDPAPDEQPGVEPGVRCLVNDRQLVEVLADLDPVLTDVEDTGVALEQRRVDFVDLDVAGDGPIETDEIDQGRQPFAQQVADPAQPFLVLGPGAQDEVLATGEVDAFLRQRVVAIGDDDGVPVRDIRDARRGQVRRAADDRRVELGAGRRDREAGRNDDPDVPLITECPCVERRKGRPNPDVAGRSRGATGQVEVEPERRRLVKEEVGREADVDDRVIRRRVRRDGQASRPRGGPELRRLALDDERRPIEEVARRQRPVRRLLDQVRLVVRRLDRDRNVNDTVLRCEGVGRLRDDGEPVVGGQGWARPSRSETDAHGEEHRHEKSRADPPRGHHASRWACDARRRRLRRRDQRRVEVSRSARPRIAATIAARMLMTRFRPRSRASTQAARANELASTESRRWPSTKAAFARSRS